MTVMQQKYHVCTVSGVKGKVFSEVWQKYDVCGIKMMFLKLPRQGTTQQILKVEITTQTETEMSVKLFHYFIIFGS
jgi:hypothetical protein